MTECGNFFRSEKLFPSGGPPGGTRRRSLGRIRHRDFHKHENTARSDYGTKPPGCAATSFPEGTRFMANFERHFYSGGV